MLHKAKILIVEDIAILAKELKYNLEKNGYTITAIAPSGSQAIQFFKEKRPDLILMDIGLKGEIDGIQTVEILNALQKVPVIYLTAFQDDATKHRAMQTKPVFYRPKPVNIPQLLSDIQFVMQDKL